MALAVLLALAILPPAASRAQRETFCPEGASPRFVLGFASMKAQLGAFMGDPVECEHPNDANGDVLQHTSTGLAFWRKSTNTPTFTDGYVHLGLVETGWVVWLGDSIDPPYARGQGVMAEVGAGGLPIGWRPGGLGPTPAPAVASGSSAVPTATRPLATNTPALPPVAIQATALASGAARSAASGGVPTNVGAATSTPVTGAVSAPVAATPAPTAANGATTGGTFVIRPYVKGPDCHPSYPEFCIPPAPPDIDCKDIPKKNFTVRRAVEDPDPHRLAKKGENVGCPG
ncbi:MAG: hypothetical protein U0821_27190 [Chloroflexota bacterium]